MAYRYLIDTSVNCVFVQHAREIGIDEIQEQMAVLVEDLAYRKDMNLLRDLSGTKLPAGYTLKRFAEYSVPKMKNLDEKLGVNRKVAWVLGSSEDFRIVHQWCVSLRLNMMVSERRPFVNLGNAKEWLGFDKNFIVDYPDYPDPLTPYPPDRQTTHSSAGKVAGKDHLNPSTGHGFQPR